MYENVGEVAVVPARAAIAGNPSDGHGGAVLAVPVSGLSTRVNLGDGAAGDGDTARAGRDAMRLIDAAASVFCESTGCDALSGVWNVETTIPREVGLSGSSAITIASLEVMCAVRDVTISRAALAAMARSVEVDHLGWSAGLQDRVVQAHRLPMLMRFDAASMSEVEGWETGRYEIIDAELLPPMFVAWDQQLGEPSGVTHGRPPRASRNRVAAAMARSARCALDAAAALAKHDMDWLASSVRGTLAARLEVFEVSPDHVGLADRYAADDAVAVNFAGSGGAVVGVSLDGSEPIENARRVAEASGHGFVVV